MIRILAFLGAALTMATGGAQASTPERIIASLSQKSVGITTDFDGSQIFVFGAIERDRLADERDEELDVIIAITGPDQRVILRKKDRRFGIWVNAESVEIDAAPSFYAVASSGPLQGILSETSDLRHRITIDKAIRLVGEAGKVANPGEFSEAIVRIRRDKGIYFEDIGGVEIISGTLFQTTVDLPANLVEGDYQAKVFLLRGGRVVDDFATKIEVRKVGLERWLYNLAHEHSLLYGLFSIFVALLAGWGASEVFRQLRR
ncbi:MAG: TIGR02186 family protein [Pseudomonadota bacterium]